MMFADATAFSLNNDILYHPIADLQLLKAYLLLVVTRPFLKLRS